MGGEGFFSQCQLLIEQKAVIFWQTQEIDLHQRWRINAFCLWFTLPSHVRAQEAALSLMYHKALLLPPSAKSLHREWRE